MQTDSETPKSFVLTYLPWVVAAGALLFFVVTLPRWVTFSSFTMLPKVLGWDWRPVTQAPLHYLLTYPIHWLPGGWQVFCLNLFSAACAALTLAMLARSVALLPRDRTREQRQLEQSEYSLLTIRFAWVPPLFAVLVGALQFSFWLNASAATGEMLDLALFAYITRCLLEYRIDERDSWLNRAAFVYGLAITNNFAMIGFLPAFIVAVVWIKGLGSAEVESFLHMLLWGLAGLTLYLLLPAIGAFSGTTEQSFWELLRANVGLQKYALVSFPRFILVFISLTSLLPVLFIGIRWPAQSGDTSAVGGALTNLMTHVIHAVFFIACLYVAFDPPFSPRHLGSPYQLLPFYYLGALSIGYFSGYFLLVFGPRPVKSWQRPSPLRSGVQYLILALVWIGFLVVPVRLFLQNRPEIAHKLSPDLARLGQLTAGSLPPDGAVVLSDNLYRLYAVTAALDQQGTTDKYVLVNTTALNQPAYHRYLVSKHGERWPGLYAGLPLSQRIDQPSILQAVVKLSKKTPLWYLHPSYGYYFEKFQLRPRDLAYVMSLYATNEVVGPVLTAEEIRQNDAFWQSALKETQALGARVSQASSPEEVDPTDMLVASMYSRALNFFGVELQKAGALAQAGRYFGAALQVNTNNPTALINFEYNRRLQSGRRANPEPSEAVKKRLKPYLGNWQAILEYNGPLDEPNSCFLLGHQLALGNNFRQSAQELLRVVHFWPTNFAAQVFLSTVLIRAGFPKKGLEKVEQIRHSFNMAEFDLDAQLSLLEAEAWGHAKQNELETAVQLLQEAQKEHPAEERPFYALASIYIDAGHPAEAANVFRIQMQLQPTNATPFVNFAARKIINKEYPEAIQVLTGFLQKYPKNVPARMNRAIAYLLNNQLNQAEEDYLKLLRQSSPPAPGIFYGLGEIAWLRHDREKAIKYYQDYLDSHPPDPAQVKAIKERLQTLESGDL